MGNCAGGDSMQQDLDDSMTYLDFEYPNDVTLKIKEPDYGYGLSRRKVRFSLTMPKLVEYKTLIFNNSALRASMCVLPGQDPGREATKKCQDGLFATDSNGCVFAALFDGHGTKGEAVVEFCIGYLQSYFKDNRAAFDLDPKHSLEVAILSCDEALSHASTVESSMAGTTAVVMYVNASGIHVGSVGDSRCILGTATSQEVRQQFNQPKPDTSSNFNAFNREIEDAPNIAAVPLSTDQKPNHEGEMERILQAGGKVARLMDENGNRVGPYRVWNATGRLPGLAMSRSIGDRVAHSVGVTAMPIVESFDLDPNDKFIILASDGVWDVMDNKDAVNLVERFRRRCHKGPNRGLPKRVRPLDVHIAHLLALEARYRWLDVVQEEDVMIDDISAMVIELDDMPTSFISPAAAITRVISVSKQSMVVQDELNQPSLFSGEKHRGSEDSPKLKNSIHKGLAESGKLSVSRKDKLRGSVVLNEDERAMLNEDP